MEILQLLQYSNNVGNNALAPTSKRGREDGDQQTAMINQKPPQMLSSSGNYHQVSRMLSSAAASASGHGTAAADVFSYTFDRSGTDIDTIVHNQSERLIAELKEFRRLSLEAAMAAFEQVAAKRLREEEAEMNKAIEINLILQERVKLLSKEHQKWIEAVKQSETVLHALRHHNFPPAGVPEGGADDAQSCCYAGNMDVKQVNCIIKKKKYCKACMENEVSVLLLPCRHLCLCSGCEPKLSRCPVCSATKNATLNVFLC